MPYVGVAVTPLCEPVPNGRATTSNSTVCLTILWMKALLPVGDKTASLWKT